ncbi:MAG: ATP-dependent DNA helicase, partial [Alphaproteobacteria bacterium]|nr:ATP-dependent DNA helicase [Alphaproteobacteria bacterium]
MGSSRRAAEAIDAPALDAPALVANASGAVWLEPGGKPRAIALADAGLMAQAGPPPLLCHAPATAAKIGCPRFPALDLLELYAFVHPAVFCLPTVRGLSAALGLALPVGLMAEAALLPELARLLLKTLAMDDDDAKREAAPIAAAMARGGWPWAAAAGEVLGAAAQGGLDVWNRLPEWSEHAPQGQPGSQPVEPAEARTRLAALLGTDAEARPQQADYASAVCASFQPRNEDGAALVTLAEAGTGVGKTLGYIAPASLWAEKNQSPVWLSTFTKNLQRQIDRELDNLYPDPALKARKVVIRKGRENYLCLLNLEDAARGVAANAESAVAVGLMARWARRTRDGDMVGGDFPAWLAGLIGRNRSLGLTDRRGECIFSACPHYRKCYIERGVRRARRADMVIANHALVMTQAAFHGLLGGDSDDPYLPQRYVFDEGHHVFNAADSAFSAHLTGLETAELRRWVLGAESSGRRGGASRARGLARRLEDLVADAETADQLAAAVRAAKRLPGPDWRQRLSENNPRGETEKFLALTRAQVLARSDARGGGYSIEAETGPAIDGLLDAAARLDGALAALAEPLMGLAARLIKRLDEDASELDAASRQRIEALCRGFARRGGVTIAGWRRMLAGLGGETPEEHVDWFAIERSDGREIDVGMHRHWIDPTIPFAEHVAGPAHGVLITSATLRDGTGDAEADWRAAEIRTGAPHLARPPVRAEAPSPFDYGEQTRVLVVTDVRRDAPDQVAAAYRELFRASGGGALGLFTAIARLRAVHGRIAPALDGEGIALYAQHVDALDTSTLVDIFRAEENACLLGTDAVRDGVDVPGRSLRLIVFDRVPWPRPDLLHRARRRAAGGTGYDDMLTRLKLRQAFGRLVRRADDKGVFVL